MPSSSSVLTSKHRCPTKNMFCSELMVWNKAASADSYPFGWTGLRNLEQSGGNWLPCSWALASHLWFSWRALGWLEDREQGGSRAAPFPRVPACCGAPRSRERLCAGPSSARRCSGPAGQVLRALSIFLLAAGAKVASNSGDSQACVAGVHRSQDVLAS